MSTPSRRIEVFQDTMNWIKMDKDLSDSVVTAKKNTEIFWEDDYPAFDQRRCFETAIFVSKHRSYEAAMTLNNEHPETTDLI